MIRTAAINLNGITIAYVMAFANAVFACLVAFGVTLTDTEIAALLGLGNASMVLAVHIGHRVGEATATGSAGAKSRAANETLALAAERRGLELHDAQAEAPPVPPATGP